MSEGDELQDVVKYLELEQQFSTKRSSIGTPTLFVHDISHAAMDGL